MNFTVTDAAEGIVLIGAAITSCVALFGVLLAVYRWYLRQEAQDKEIERIKEEDTLIVYALSACLDGLEQLGANHTVSAAKEKLDKYINKQAHK